MVNEPGKSGEIIGSLTCDDESDVNEKSKKAISLDWQNNNFARAPRFFVHFFLPSLHDYDVKLPNFTFFGGREHKTTTFYFFS